MKKMVSVSEKEVQDFRRLQQLGVPVTFHYVPGESEEAFETYIKDEKPSRSRRISLSNFTLLPKRRSQSIQTRKSEHADQSF
ncbi:hypothetical protein [Allobaculum sp. Allo2]|uniref:hypothetical protein n=1 Tax=Allobaculum sp. Allo2 TaxID=2853432 RepID=UPI00346242A0